jgi:molecular chaperone DnaK
LKDKIKPEQSEKINKAATELKDAITANNIDTIKTKIQELKNILAEVSTEVYKTAGAAAAASTGQTAGTQDQQTTAGYTDASAGGAGGNPSGPSSP